MSEDGALADVSGPQAITIPVTDTMMEAAEILRERLTERQYNTIFEAIVHITTMELTDADYDIVDADPAECLSATTRELNS